MHILKDDSGEIVEVVLIVVLIVAMVAVIGVFATQISGLLEAGEGAVDDLESFEPVVDTADSTIWNTYDTYDDNPIGYWIGYTFKAAFGSGTASIITGFMLSIATLAMAFLLYKVYKAVV